MIHFSKTKTFYPCVSVSIRGPKKQTSKADRTPKKTSDLATDGHGYTRMRIAGFLALHREKIGTKLYGYVLAKRYTRTHTSLPDRDRLPSELWLGRSIHASIREYGPSSIVSLEPIPGIPGACWNMPRKNVRPARCCALRKGRWGVQQVPDG